MTWIYSWIMLLMLTFTESAHIGTDAPRQWNGTSQNFDAQKPNSNEQSSLKKIKKIVIDPGHGGRDLGCSGQFAHEKNVVLQISKKLATLLRQVHPEIEIIFTRDTDVFIPLNKRIHIANRNQADLFLSLHCNAFSDHSIHGSETYVMGLHTAAENLAVAKRENASILLESDYKTSYDGYNPHSSESHIILNAFQNAYLNQSIELADKIERSFVKRTPFKSRGVKQAGFVVLRKATMPSILIEAGFLSNPRDEAYLISDDGQQDIAYSILAAISEYKSYIEANSLPEPKVASVEPKDNPRPIYSTRIDQVTPTRRIIRRDTSYSYTEPTEKVDKIKISSITYRVQIAASINSPIQQKTKQWAAIDDLQVVQEENMYKYLTGQFKNIAEAELYKDAMRKGGFKGAFIVAYRDGQRVQI